VPIFDEDGNYVQPAEPGPETGGSSPAEIVVYGSTLRWWCEDPAFDIKRAIFSQFYWITVDGQEDRWLFTLWPGGFQTSRERDASEQICSKLEKFQADFKRNGQWSITYEKDEKLYSYHDAGTAVELRGHDGPEVRMLTRLRTVWRTSEIEQQHKFIINHSPGLDPIDYALLTLFQIHQDRFGPPRPGFFGPY
jgi:hypothetical protein